MEAVAEPSNKKVFAATVEFVKQFEKYHYRNGKSSVEISEEIKIESQMITFPTRSFSPFYEVFKEKIQGFVEAGIRFDMYARKKLMTTQRIDSYDEEIPALVLSMEDLGVGFEVCLIPLALSVALFAFEVIYSKIRKFVNESLVAAFAVLTFIRIHRLGI